MRRVFQKTSAAVFQQWHRGAPLSNHAMRWATTSRSDVRNIAIIAHVDHGKTTLVDALLNQSGTVKASNRIMDSNDQEKERGITILAKNTALVFPDGFRINVVDTPGHLDFSGEVERVLQTVEGFLLLVDAAEGVKPGTRYVLRKALKLKLKPIVIVNKIDKDASNIERTKQQVEELFLDVAEDADQLDDIFFLYGSGRAGYIDRTPTKGGTVQPLFDEIKVRIPEPTCDDTAPLQMLISNLEEAGDYTKAIGRIFAGSVEEKQIIKAVRGDDSVNVRVRKVEVFKGVERVPATKGMYGDIVCLTLEEPPGKKAPFVIGASLCDENNVQPVVYHAPDEPTFSLNLSVNASPWAGKEIEETRFSRFDSLKGRLRREALTNTALRLNYTKNNITMSGRGPLHLSVILEAMRREGHEFQLAAPKVLTKVIDGKECEPYEKLTLEVAEDLVGPLTSILAEKMAEIGDMENIANGRISMEAVLPVRVMLDFPTVFNRLTKGDGVMQHTHDGYRPISVAQSQRVTGALVANETGTAQEYSLDRHGHHGTFFVDHGDDVYYSQIVGENKVEHQDMALNVVKKNEQLGGLRVTGGKGAKTKSHTFRPMSLEECLTWVIDGESVVITPKSIRMRKDNFSGKTINRKK